MKINRNFKDSVFTSLFSDPDLLRELYCALGDVSLPPDVPVSINTLENVFVMDKYNDISFEIAGKLVILIEQQSTINKNMALRLLMYISKVYEKMVDGKNIYSKKPISIPWPEFYVLYNGEKQYPDVEILRLSDLFEKPHDLGLSEKQYPLLELEAKVININEGRNEEILRRCSKLKQYSVLMNQIYRYKKEKRNVKKAIEEAVKYCYNHDILSEYLQKHGSGVLNMLYHEFNIEEAKEVWQEEAREEGRVVGMSKGREERSEEIINLINQGMSIDDIKQYLKQK